MTDQELRDLVAELVVSTAELRKSLAERSEEAERQRQETAKQQRETARQLRRTDKQLGALGNKFGSFAEGMALPSMERVLRRQFGMNIINPRAKASKNGRMLEIDVLAYDNGDRNEVYLVEVKSHLTSEGIQQMLKTIEEFPKFFVPLAERKIYGIIAAIDIPENLRNEVLKKGLYLARISDGTFKLQTTRGFKPKDFSPAQQNDNGRRANNGARVKKNSSKEK